MITGTMEAAISGRARRLGPPRAAASRNRQGQNPEKNQASRSVSTQIRDLADFINISSHQNGYKIILIHPAETMNAAAANALLKNLEEPPPRTLFILVTPSRAVFAAHHTQPLPASCNARAEVLQPPLPGLSSRGSKIRKHVWPQLDMRHCRRWNSTMTIIWSSTATSSNRSVRSADLNPIALAEADAKIGLAHGGQLAAEMVLRLD